MLYKVFSLNGSWEMDYCEDRYIDRKNPWKRGSLVKEAVPGYWEDMVNHFAVTHFFHKLRINPEYGIQRYPIAKGAPDMALPNIIGTCFYSRVFLWNGSDGETSIYLGGVQNTAAVWINNIFIGRHEGYSTPFELWIPDSVLHVGENTIVISVSNHRLEGYMGEPVSGLTSRAANEYTGGITGGVELRVYHSSLRDAAILVSEDCNQIFVKTEAVKEEAFHWSVYDEGRLLKSGENKGDFSFDTEGLEKWSPENPKLYTLEIRCEGGVLIRRFGVRRLLADGVHFQLNGKPYYLRGICEHCYFPETIHPNHDLAYYRSIIKAVKKLGFNFIRFHTYIPEEEYMQAADELGMLVHVECPNNTTIYEWKEIVKFCRRHTSVVIYCCGNELLIDEAFIEYLAQCAEEVHEKTDALFSPMSALRGLEYHWLELDQEQELVEKPFKHHPRRFEVVGKFSDMYSSYTNGQNSYYSLECNPEEVDSWSSVYNKPRVSHEICIDGTYTDLSIKNRYKGWRVGKTDMFTSLERHLEVKGLLKRAPLYFRNSSEWQRRIRKNCFESVRLSNHLAGYDFLGPIDTHWHTFGYDVGMMNEFYELKPGESVRNVLMYNSPTVILTDLGKKKNFMSEEVLSCGIYTSHYGDANVKAAMLSIYLSLNGKMIERKSVQLECIENGQVSKLFDFSVMLPEVNKPGAMKLYVVLDGEDVYAENEWELYLFPAAQPIESSKIIVSNGMQAEELIESLRAGKSILLLGSEPFHTLPTTFRISLAGRTSGNLATVIEEHPIFKDMPHEGFCGWQFVELMEGGSAVCFECDDVPFKPIIEVVSSHKFVIRQAAMFEFHVLNGKLLVCSFHFSEEDPAANWLRNRLIEYTANDTFKPEEYLSEQQLWNLINGQMVATEGNTNFAFNVNDKTAIRKYNKM